MLLVDKDKVYIKDYRDLLVMEDTFIKIKMADYSLNIRGEKLELYYYDQHEIRLNGVIKVIEYV